ncbi:hypothetical protein [Halomarina pelagica]|uniref:hypothetical protein n=1 Tax=Halomarina pelagica TaxID=2961599 RepID=UPI0020C2B3CE|nr:hypothetical protein [Halomarina sp. BND7]
MSTVQVTFRMEDTDAEASFIRNYLVSAWKRFETMEAFEKGWFWRNGHYGRHGIEYFKGGRILLMIDGDPETVVDEECDRWDSLVEDGAIESWSVLPFEEIGYDSVYSKAVDNVGKRGADLFMRLKPLLTQTSLDLYEALDEQIAMVGDEGDHNPKGIGFWVVINTLMKQNGYDWYDEIDGCTKSTKNRLKSMTAYKGGGGGPREASRNNKRTTGVFRRTVRVAR